MIGKIRGQWRTLMSLVAAICLSFGAAACFAQEKSDELKALQKERRELLSEAATVIKKIYSPGGPFISPSFQEVLHAHRDSFQADLDYFETPEERIEAMEKHQKAADSLVELAENLLKAARETRLVVFQAKAHTLEVQIELVKEKRKKGK